MAMDARIKEIMLMFTPEALSTQFMELYQYEYGEKKIIEIIHNVENNEKIQQYLNNILNNDLKPTAKDLEILMNTVSYFMFSKEETLCLGALATFVLWRNRWMIKNHIWDVLEQEEIDNTLIDICVQLIDNCKVNKYNKYNNFFIRFERKIVLLARQEGIN
jgi:stage III sporulation protein SpoIIIAA